MKKFEIGFAYDSCGVAYYCVDRYERDGKQFAGFVDEYTWNENHQDKDFPGYKIERELGIESYDASEIHHFDDIEIAALCDNPELDDYELRADRIIGSPKNKIQPRPQHSPTTGTMTPSVPRRRKGAMESLAIVMRFIGRCFSSAFSFADPRGKSCRYSKNRTR